jgi:hypothetical protein
MWRCSSINQIDEKKKQKLIAALTLPRRSKLFGQRKKIELRARDAPECTAPKNVFCSIETTDARRSSIFVDHIAWSKGR